MAQPVQMVTEYATDPILSLLALAVVVSVQGAHRLLRADTNHYILFGPDDTTDLHWVFDDVLLHGGGIADDWTAMSESFDCALVTHFTRN